MRRLVALDLPAGVAFYDAARRVLDAGEAFAPIDQRLPAPARARLFASLAPSAIVDAAGEHAWPGGRPIEEGDALVIATSGSTGEPKGVVLTYDALAASARASNDYLAVEPRADRLVACLPPAHIGGLSVLLRAYFSETPVEIHDGFDPGKVSEAAARGATVISLVPTALARLGEAADRYRAILLGGSAMPEDLAPNVVRTYGMTETASGVVYNGVALAGVDLAISARGEIGVRAPMLLRCYRDGSDPKDARGFLWTGDLGRLEGGRLEVLGRANDLIITGGENVWPDAVEAVLARHEAIAEVAVFALPDPEWGQRVCCAIVLAPGARAPSLEELRDLVRAELGAFHAPKQLCVFDELPRSALGKVRRGELAHLVAAGS